MRPSASTASASSVQRSAPGRASALRRTWYRNIWGVCADHRPSRGSVLTMRPSGPARFSVPTIGTARRPPTSSCSSSCSSRASDAGSMHGRTASWIRIQSSSRAPATDRQQVANRFAARLAAASKHRYSGPRTDRVVEPAIVRSHGHMDLLRRNSPRPVARCCAGVSACRRASSIAWAIAVLTTGRRSGCQGRPPESTRSSASTTHDGCRSTSFRAAGGPLPVRRRTSRAHSRRRSAGTLRRSARP